MLGLTNGTYYIFRVAASNDIGTGGWSVPSSPIRPRTVPLAPTAVTGTPGDTLITASWQAPSSSGGSEITDYALQYQLATGVCVEATPVPAGFDAPTLNL